MNWSAIVYVFKRLDDHLSDAVYAHGRHLAGQEKIVRKHPHVEVAIKRLQTRGFGLRRVAQWRTPLRAVWAKRSGGRFA